MREEPQRLTQLETTRYRDASLFAPMMRGLLVFSLLGSTIGASGLLGARSAFAAPVGGKVSLPDELTTGRRRPGYWRLENGSVPTAGPPFRGDTVVLLVGLKGTSPPAKTVTVDVAGLQASPSTLVVGPGSVVEFKNADRVAHDLSTPADSAVMAIERLTPGGVRRQRFSKPGAHVVRCSEYPHLEVSVLVVETPHFAVVDEKGGFKLGDLPAGKATLKVWSQGRWVHQQEIDTASANDLQITVAAASKSAE